MLSVLFWNVMGRRIEALCANLVHRHDVDILVLAECANPAAVVRALNRTPGGRVFHWHRPGTANRLAVFSRFPATEFVEVESAQRYTVHALTTTRDEFLLVSVHSMSGLRVRVLEQTEELRRLARRVAELEDTRGHTRTMLIGDLNADPYDPRMLDAVGLHAQRLRQIAEQGSRRVAGIEYRYLFNPMWRFLGVQPPEPQGTYYRRKSLHDTRFWHLFDQALLRPALLPYFADQDVVILRDDGTTSFQKTDETPDKKVASDHFPILIKLSYPGV
jgi:endonuclease/exonuclease/phosphatase family metal-dependent hydrolase